MSDRISIFLIIFLIAMGIYSYQQVLHEQSGVTVLEEMLEGQKRKSNDQSDTAQSLISFEYDQNLDALKEQIVALKLANEQYQQNERSSIRSLLKQNADLLRLRNDFVYDVNQYYENAAHDEELAYEVDGVIRKLKDLAELNKILKNELDFLLINIKGSDQQFSDRSKFIDEKIEEISHKGDVFNSGQLAYLLRDFDKFLIEKEKINRNLQDHLLYVNKKTNQILDITLQIVRSMGSIGTADVAPLVKGYHAGINNIRKSIPVSTKITMDKMNLFDDYCMAEQQIIELMAVHHNIDLMAFRERLGLSNTTLSGKTMDQQEQSRFEDQDYEELISIVSQGGRKQ